MAAEEALFSPLAAQCRCCVGQAGVRLRCLCPGELSLRSMKHARQGREGTRRTDRQEGVIQPERSAERRNCGTDGANAQPDRRAGRIS